MVFSAHSISEFGFPASPVYDPDHLNSWIRALKRGHLTPKRHQKMGWSTRAGFFFRKTTRLTTKKDIYIYIIGKKTVVCSNHSGFSLGCSLATTVGQQKSQRQALFFGSLPRCWAGDAAVAVGAQGWHLLRQPSDPGPHHVSATGTDPLLSGSCSRQCLNTRGRTCKRMT